MLSVVSNLNTAIKHSHTEVVLKTNKKSLSLLDPIWDSNLINGYTIKKSNLRVYLKYSYLGAPNIRNLKFLSKPGMRKFVKAKDLTLLKKHNNFIYLLTSKGVLLLEDAIKLNIGGEILLSIYI